MARPHVTEGVSALAPAGPEIRPAYRPDIDGLRAVAIIAVVLYHISGSLLPGGFIGVDVFFVISGFLISSLIFKELDQGHFSFADFYIRRIRRIFPALILMMAALWVTAIVQFTRSEFVQLGQYIVGGGLFASNLLQWRYAGYFDTDAALKPLQHLWSLGIEEQFYIVWPVAVVLLWPWRRRFPVLLLAAMAASFAFNVWRTPHHATGAFFLPFGRAWELLAGSLLAWLERYGRMPALLARERRIGRLSGGVALKDVAAVLSVLLLAAGLVLINSDSEFPGWWVLLPIASAVLVIWAGERAWINRILLANPAMVFVGLISYPLYIWHWPLLSLLRITSIGEPSLAARFGVAGVSVVLAILTYGLVERPLRHSQAHRGAIVGGLVAAMAVLSVLGSLSAMQVLQTPRMIADQRAEDAALHAWSRITNCASFVDKKAIYYGDCRIWGDPALKKTYVIWGDSHANSWAGVFAVLAKERGARLVEISRPACPPIAGVRRTTPHLQMGEACNSSELADAALAKIEAMHPQRIILVARWTYYTSGLLEFGDHGNLIAKSFITAGDEAEATAQTSARDFPVKLTETIARLAKAAPVLVVRTAPTLHLPTEAGLRRDPDGFEPTLAQYRAQEALPNAVIDKAARDIPGVQVLDPAIVLCDARKCHAISHGVRVYEDDNTHLSNAGAMLFLPALRRLLP
jgi:peptidoglycan/LPS O-acetylase OafA/YrhL